jgi:hypothetical protein
VSFVVTVPSPLKVASSAPPGRYLATRGEVAVVGEVGRDHAVAAERRIEPSARSVAHEGERSVPVPRSSDREDLAVGLDEDVECHVVAGAQVGYHAAVAAERPIERPVGVVPGEREPSARSRCPADGHDLPVVLLSQAERLIVGTDIGA